MKVGDLVKVYNFTERARTKFKAQHVGNFDNHFVGLVVEYVNMDYRKVLRCRDSETESYRLDRLEVISESR